MTIRKWRTDVKKFSLVSEAPLRSHQACAAVEALKPTVVTSSGRKPSPPPKAFVRAGSTSVGGQRGFPTSTVHFQSTIVSVILYMPGPR